MREEDGRRRRKADTELKTKTSHVNVGNKDEKEEKGETRSTY